MNFLTDDSSKLFGELSNFDFFSSFTFVGGSAIAHYLNHRLSEDLDFFSWDPKLPKETNDFIKNISKSHNVNIAFSDSHLFELFIDGIKITLFANDWESLERERTVLNKNIYIAKLELLTAMKVNALSLRAKYRDYYDLYVLNMEKFGIKEMFEYSMMFIPGITKKIFAMQITYIDDIEDENINHLKPKYDISLRDIQKHFEQEITKIL